MQVLCNDVCKDFTKLSQLAYRALSWLLALAGLKVVAQDAKMLPEGCRPIPAGHFNFDPQMAEFFGGKDGVNRAIIWQRFIAWIETNRLAGRNMRDGQAYTYNTYDQWAADIRIFHPKTIQRHVQVFEAMGLLSSQQPHKRDGDCTKHYTSPLRASDNPEQMRLWSESNAPRVGTKDSALLTMHNLSAQKPSKAKKINTNTRAGAIGVTKGGVGVFPNHIPGSEPVERKAEIPEARPQADEHEPATHIPGTPDTAAPVKTPFVPRVSPATTGDEPTEEETKSSGDTKPVDVPEWANEINEPPEVIAKMFAEHGLELTGWYEYGRAQRSVTNPVGLARVKVRQGLKPPVKPPANDYSAWVWTDGDYKQWLAERNKSRLQLAPPLEPDTPECAIWKKVYGQLEAQLDRNNFDSWVRACVFLRCEGDVYVIGAANPYARDMLQHRLYRDVRRILNNLTDRPTELLFEQYEKVEREVVDA